MNNKQHTEKKSIKMMVIIINGWNRIMLLNEVDDILHRRCALDEDNDSSFRVKTQRCKEKNGFLSFYRVSLSLTALSFDLFMRK